MWQGKALRRADCVSGLAFILLGGYVLYEGLQMPMGGVYAGVDNPWYASPASFPLLIGGLLVILGAMVGFKGLRKGGYPGITGAVKRACARLLKAPGRNGVVVVALLWLYYLLIKFHWIPGHRGENYVASSSVFLSVFALWFYRPHSKFPKPLIICLILAGAVGLSWGVAKLFSGPLRVPLP